MTITAKTKLEAWLNAVKKDMSFMNPEMKEAIAVIEKLKAALDRANNWFELLKADQHEKLGQGLEKACEEWPCLDHQSFDFTEIQEALAIDPEKL